MADDLSGDVGQLALAGAQALVTAMATDGWALVKQRFTGLTAGHERRMEAARERLAAASPAEAPRLRDEEIQAWTGRLRDALEDDPARRADLRRVIADLGGVVQTQTVSNPVQSIHAEGGSSVTQVTSGRDTHLTDRRKFTKNFIFPFGFVVHVTKTAAKAATVHPIAATVVGAAVVAGAAGTGIALSHSAGVPAGVRWQETVTLPDCFAANLGVSPAATNNYCDSRNLTATKSTDVAFWTAGLTDASGIPALARWTVANSPSASDCEQLLSRQAVTLETPLRSGDEFCLAMHDGGFAFIRLTAASPVQVSMTAEVFAKP